MNSCHDTFAKSWIKKLICFSTTLTQQAQWLCTVVAPMFHTVFLNFAAAASCDGGTEVNPICLAVVACQAGQLQLFPWG